MEIKRVASQSIPQGFACESDSPCIGVELMSADEADRPAVKILIAGVGDGQVSCEASPPEVPTDRGLQ